MFPIYDFFLLLCVCEVDWLVCTVCAQMPSRPRGLRSLHPELQAALLSPDLGAEKGWNADPSALQEQQTLSLQGTSPTPRGEKNVLRTYKTISKQFSRIKRTSTYQKAVLTEKKKKLLYMRASSRC